MRDESKNKQALTFEHSCGWSPGSPTQPRSAINSRFTFYVSHFTVHLQTWHSDALFPAMAQLYPTIIPGLRSPYDQIKGLVHFGRMLDKIRLGNAGKLPPAWQAARGTPSPNTFDSRCCRFLQIDYAALEAETLKGDKSDEQLLDWAFQHGRRPTEEEIQIWNAFMSKRGWRDDGTQRLHERLAEIGLPPGPVETMFDFIDLDEGRRALAS